MLGWKELLGWHGSSLSSSPRMWPASRSASPPRASWMPSAMCGRGQRRSEPQRSALQKLSRRTARRDVIGLHEVTRNLVVRFDPQILLAHGADPSIPLDFAVQGLHYFVCIGRCAAYSVWVPAYSRQSNGRIKLRRKDGLSSWVEGDSWLSRRSSGSFLTRPSAPRSVLDPTRSGCRNSHPRSSSSHRLARSRPGDPFLAFQQPGACEHVDISAHLFARGLGTHAEKTHSGRISKIARLEVLTKGALVGMAPRS